jgi:DNA-binding IclR family transcriptional regulator
MTGAIMVRAVERTARIVQTIRRSGPLNVSEISRLTGVPYATSYRIVHTLLQEGFLRRADTGRGVLLNPD